jgi:hypothetical protein
MFSCNFFLSNATTCPYKLRGPSSWPWPKCNRLLRLGRPLGVVTVPRWCEWYIYIYIYIYIYKRGVPRGAINLNSTGDPDHGRYGYLPLQGKIPTAEPGIEPGTSWLVVTSYDHQATRLVACRKINRRQKFSTWKCHAFNNTKYYKLTAVPRAFTSPVNHTIFTPRDITDSNDNYGKRLSCDEMPRGVEGTYGRFGEIYCFLTA